MAFSKELVKNTLKVTVSSDGKLVKEYMRAYLCKSDTELTNDEVGSAIGILPGAPHPDWNAARVRDINIDRRLTIEPYCAWDATFQYSTEATVPENSSSTDPELRRVNRSMSPTNQQRFITKDKHKKLITDKAGSPFDGGVPVTDFMGALNFERNEAHTGFNMQTALALSGHLNSTPFMGYAAGTLMLEVTATERWEGGYHFWATRYTMNYDKDGWQPRPLNAGLYQKIDGVRVVIDEEDSDGKPRPAKEPQPLDIDGHVIPVADRPDACIFLEVEHYDEMEFADLNLPVS